ncbi:MAG: hypothetical protein FWF82_02470 [Oscillospiraceae bacterium]|jgi:hypothetical protein|nr:hypothetical protein [Oscillospiraceae bacterium]
MEQKKFYTYKGYHLVRKNREIYYGNMAGDYVAKIDVQSTKKVKDLDIADKVKIQLLPTDTENLDITKIKTTSRENLFDALEVAHMWLGKANSSDVRIKS